jgi:3-hydroxy-9,10-secoandrosta-1,3,5(10)-triene-9,17-dione monooxygenase reductase component
MTINGTDPFATPEEHRSPVRRFRGRLPAAVTLWTSYDRDKGDDGSPALTGKPAGLTMSSALVVDGEPGRLLGVLDEESDLWAAVEASGVFAMTPLGPADRQLGDRFAGLLPAPGGPFRGYEWSRTEYGPVLADRDTWAGCRLDAARPFGWGLLIEATIDELRVGLGTEPLVYYRGRYRELPVDR